MLIVTYDTNDHNADFQWMEFKEIVKEYLSDRKFPLQLIAENSNWRGQTGYAEADSVDELLTKVFSFDGSYYEFHKVKNSYEFRTATHDVPTGFTIKVRSV